MSKIVASFHRKDIDNWDDKSKYYAKSIYLTKLWKFSKALINAPAINKRKWDIIFPVYNFDGYHPLWFQWKYGGDKGWRFLKLKKVNQHYIAVSRTFFNKTAEFIGCKYGEIIEILYMTDILCLKKEERTKKQIKSDTEKFKDNQAEYDRLMRAANAGIVGITLKMEEEKKSSAKLRSYKYSGEFVPEVEKPLNYIFEGEELSNNIHSPFWRSSRLPMPLVEKKYILLEARRMLFGFSNKDINKGDLDSSGKVFEDEKNKRKRALEQDIAAWFFYQFCVNDPPMEI